MPITILELLSADTIKSAVEKINYNFDQLLLNGGGSPGIAGPAGPAGIPGIQGTPGIVWTNGTGAPIATSGNTGDLYLEDNGDVWEYDSVLASWTNTGLSLLGPAGPTGSAATTYFDILDTSDGTTPGAGGPGFDVVFPVLDTDLLNRPISTDIRAGLFGAYPNGYDTLNPVPFDDLYLNIGISTLFLHQPAGGYHILFTNSDSSTIIDVDNIIKYPFIQSDATDKLFIATRKDATLLSLDGIELNTMDTNLVLKSGRNINIETSGNPINDLTGLTENGNINIVSLDVIDGVNVTPNDVLVHNTLKNGGFTISDAGLKVFSPTGTKVAPGTSTLKAAYLYAGADDSSPYNMGVGNGTNYNIYLNPFSFAQLSGNLILRDPTATGSFVRRITVGDSSTTDGGNLFINAAKPSTGNTPGDTLIIGGRSGPDGAGNVYLSKDYFSSARSGNTVVGATDPTGLFNIGSISTEFIRFYDDASTIENWNKIDWYTVSDYIINIGTVAGSSAEAFKIKQNKDVVMGLSGGFFGIFQNNPQAGLHIGASIDLLSTHASMVINDNQPSIIFGDSDAGYTIGGIGVYDTMFNISLTTDVTSFKINTKTDTELFWNPVETPFQIETSTGIVGINMEPITLTTWEAMLQVNGGIYIKGDATSGSNTTGNLVFAPLASKVRKINFDDGNNIQTTNLEILGCNNVGGSGTGGLGGDILLKGGYGYFGGGDITLLSGTSGINNSSGIINIASADNLYRTGDVIIETGEAFQYQSGNITIQPGKATVIPGDIYLKSSLDSSNVSVGKIDIEGYDLYSTGLVSAVGTHYVYWNSATNKITRSATAISSRRFKENFGEYIQDSEIIYSLVPTSFTYKEDFSQNTISERVNGYIAEDVANIIPEIVFVDSENIPMGIHYDKLVIPIIEEVKKQKEKIEYLEDKINKLMELINGTK